MNSNTPKRKPGNPGGERGPYKPDEEKMVKITITLEPDQKDWLKATPHGPSQWVRDRINEAI